MRVLALGHEATRTGAPLLLLHLLREWQRNDDVHISVVFRRPGPLLEDFRTWGVRTLSPAAVEAAWRPLSRVKHSLQVRQRSAFEEGPSDNPARISRVRLRQRSLWDRNALRLRRLRSRPSPDVVFANTATLGDLLPYFQGTPIVSYVHERALLLDEIALPGKVATQLNLSNQVAAVAEVVRDDLATHYGVDASRVAVVRPFALPNAQAPAAGLSAKASIMERHRLPPDAFVVGAVGALSWVKDPESFVRLAAHVQALQPRRPVVFLWLGAAANAQQMARYAALPTAFGVTSSVRFVGPSPDPNWFYEAIDLLAVTSRTDSFPLVVLEAAQAGKPCVCFEASGGAVEFVRSDAGVAVADHDIEAMAAAVVALTQDNERRTALGETARKRVAAEHSLETVAATLLSITLEAAGWTNPR